MSIEANLFTVRAHFFLNAQGIASGGLDGDGLGRIELACAASTDHQIAVVVCDQPGEVGFGGAKGGLISNVSVYSEKRYNVQYRYEQYLYCRHS